jgi:hypothetical protein
VPRTPQGLNKPVKIIVPCRVGAGRLNYARFVECAAGQSLGQSFRQPAGAGSVIGTDAAANPRLTATRC